uniref:Uncharacterized protein n=1 Tax=Anopheles dirus TaxID=7168 RepID=A0A182NIH3_9DIPT
MASVCKHLLPAWIVVVLLGLITKGYGWNLPNSYYQGAGTGGYFGGSGESALGNQAGASSGSWSAGGASGGVDRTGSFGPNQWSSGGGGGGVGAPGVAGGALGGGVGGAGFQQGASAAGSAAGVGVAQNPLDNAGGGFGGSTVGPGQYGPHHTNGNGHGAGFGGAFSGQPGGFETGAHANHAKGSYRPPFAYSVPSSHPWRYGSPASYAGGRWPWYGGGYVYRVPVAHVNPDGSYSFSYYTPYLAREESGDGNGNVAGTYGFQNEGAKHNFSFSAGPDVDLRTGFGGVPPGALDPAQYGPQSVHSRGRLPLVPQTSTQASVDGGQSTVAALPGSVGRPQDATGPNSWAPRAGVDGAGVVRNPTQTAADESELAVVGLPKAGDGATDVSRPASRNQVVRGSTEPTVSTTVNNQLPTTTSGGLFDDRVSLNELDGRGFRSNDASLPGFQSVGADGTGTTARPFGASVDQVQVPRPVNDEQNVASARFGPGQEGSRDRSYQFGYQTPDATREESADAAGNVRGSFSYNNEAGRNDLQYVAGSGMGFRPTGGSLAVPNGLPGGTAPATGGNFGGRLGGQGDGRFGGASGAFGGSQGGQTGAGGAGGVGGVGSGFGGADGSSFGQGGQVAGGTSGLGGTGSGGGFGGVDKQAQDLVEELVVALEVPTEVHLGKADRLLVELVALEELDLQEVLEVLMVDRSAWVDKQGQDRLAQVVKVA